MLILGWEVYNGCFVDGPFPAHIFLHRAFLETGSLVWGQLRWAGVRLFLPITKILKREGAMESMNTIAPSS